MNTEDTKTSTPVHAHGYASAAQLTTLEAIRLRYYLTGWKNITYTLTDGWVNQLRKLFELRFEAPQLARTDTGEITHGNGYFGFIDRGAYLDSDTERRWQSFVRGAMAQKLIDNNILIPRLENEKQ